MSNITAKMVAELREITGLGMMECKKALVEALGDLKKAEEIIRVKSGAKAGKVASRIASEGVIAIALSADHKKATIVEINCETDFVGKDANFLDFTTAVADAILKHETNSQEELLQIKLADGKTIEETRKDIIAKIGENISIRRFQYLSTEGQIASYLHGKKIGVLLDITGGDAQLGKDVAMHIVASKPLCVNRADVAQDKIEEEKHIYTQQALQSGKPAEIVAKMVDGRINKFLAEITLLEQPFVKNPDVTVGKLLQNQNAKINSFVMYVVGEGIEKKVVDFKTEVEMMTSEMK